MIFKQAVMGFIFGGEEVYVLSALAGNTTWRLGGPAPAESSLKVVPLTPYISNLWAKSRPGGVKRS